MRLRFLAIAALVVTPLAGCSSGHHPAAPGTSDPQRVDPDVVPPVITPAYVDAVFKVLEHVDGNASRALIAAKAVTPTVLKDIRAIYNDPLYAKEVKIEHQSLQGDLRNVRKPPGDVVVTVTRLISATPECIFVETSDDYSAVLFDQGPPPASGYWGLKPKLAANDPGRLNPTPWALFFNAVYQTPTSVPDQCVG